MRRSLAVLLLALASATMAAADPKPAWEAKLDAELAAIADDPAFRLSGLSVLAIRGGTIAYERQFGRRRIDEANAANDRPVTADTLFRVASISKLVVTLAALRLVEAGRLDLDRDIPDVVGYPVRNPHFPGSPVTMRMLLTHTSSLRDDGGYSWGRGQRLRDAIVPGGPLFGEGKAWSTRAKPGAFFHYANLPWGLAGEAMEAATGERFDRLVHRLVLAPLGMTGGFDPASFSRTELANLATLYRKRENLPTGEEIWRDPEGRWYAQVDDLASQGPVPRAGPDYVPGTNGTLMAPQGGLRTGARGLAQVMRMLMDGGRHDGRAFLSPATVEAMLGRAWSRERGEGDCASETGRPGLFNAWGLGIQHFVDRTGPGCGDRLVEGGGFAAVGHLGEAWGLNGIFAFDPAKRDGMIVLVGGVARDPAKHQGQYSAHYRHEERIATALHRRAIRRLAD